MYSILNFEFLVSIIAAYLIGSICSAIVVCYLYGLPDPRTDGSKNPGATNVKRLGGTVPAVITLVFDGLKGLIVLLLGKYFITSDPVQLSYLYLAALVGHCYPIFFGFSGGKGVATGVGGLLGLSWPVGGICLVWWLGFLAIFKISALAGLSTFVLAPVLCYWYFGWQVFCLISVGSILIFWRHRSNIRELLFRLQER